MERIITELLLIPFGEAPLVVINALQPDLKRIFRFLCRLSDPLPVPPSAYHPRRRQFSAETLLTSLPSGVTGRILGIADLDLYVSGLNFVFGLADPSSGRALIALPRLRQSFYGQPDDQGLFQQRVLKEAVHELGHTYGLSHCRDRRCVMAFSNSLSDTDFKSFTFCRRCSDRI